METISPVTVLAKVKKDLGEGGRLEVECEETVHKDGSQMRGRWIFFLLSEGEDGETYRSQVVVWKTVEPKAIVTVNGLAAFAKELRITVPDFPLNAGEKGVWRIDEGCSSRSSDR